MELGSGNATTVRVGDIREQLLHCILHRPSRALSTSTVLLHTVMAKILVYSSSVPSSTMSFELLSRFLKSRDVDTTVAMYR